MKKLVLFVLIVSLFSLSLTGCSFFQRPNKVVDDFLTTLKNGQFEKLGTYVSIKDGTNKNLNPTADQLNSDEGKVIKALLAKMKFEPSKTVSKQGDTAVVSVKLTTVDTKVLYAKLMQEAMPLAFASAFGGEQAQKDFESMIPSLMLKNINDPNVTMTTKDIKLNLKKVNGQYKVVLDDNFATDLFGDFGSTTK